MKYIMHIFAPTECVLNTDHGAFKLMKYMYIIYIYWGRVLCVLNINLYVYKPCFLKTKQTHKDISSGTAELGGEGGGGRRGSRPCCPIPGGTRGAKVPFQFKRLHWRNSELSEMLVQFF